MILKEVIDMSRCLCSQWGHTEPRAVMDQNGT